MIHSTFTTEFTKVLKANNDSTKGFDHLSDTNIKLICDVAKEFDMDAKATIEALEEYYGYTLSGGVVSTIKSNFDNKTTPYYILFVKDDELGWTDEFGDYSKKEVMDNKDLYYMNKTKVFKIDDERKLTEFIANKNKELNS